MRAGKETRFAAVLPAFNEANTIAGIVRGVAPFAIPIVVDDGSSDDTAVLAESAGAVVVRHPFNQGYDAALQSGLFKAIELGFEYAVTLDADGQHAPDILEAFKVELLSGADLVVGERDRHQRFAEMLFGLVGSLLWGMRDPLCGMKGYKLVHLKKVGVFDSYRSIGTEFALRCARSGMDVRCVPVPTRDRQGVSRFGAGLRPNLRILRALLLGLHKATSIKN